MHTQGRYIKNILIGFTFFSLLSCGPEAPLSTRPIQGPEDPKGVNIEGGRITLGQHVSENDDFYAMDGRDGRLSFEASEDKINDQPTFEPTEIEGEPTRIVAINGDNVTGLGYFSGGLGEPGFFIAEHGISGTATAGLPSSGRQTYDGHYTAAGIKDSEQSSYATEATIIADFGNNEIRGNTNNTTPDYQGTFEGVITVDGIAISIVDYYGRHDAFGAFFGEDADEVAVGFTDGPATGMLYGKKD